MPRGGFGPGRRGFGGPGMMPPPPPRPPRHGGCLGCCMPFILAVALVAGILMFLF